MSDIPRHVRLDRLVPVEGAIDDALRVITRLPADVRLTDAVTLLQAARDSISDYINNSVPVRRQVWSGLMAGFIPPAEMDFSSTGTFDQGGPTEQCCKREIERNATDGIAYLSVPCTCGKCPS